MKYEFVSGCDMRSGLRQSLGGEYAASVYMVYGSFLTGGFRMFGYNRCLISEYTVFPLSFIANFWIFLSPSPNRIFCDEELINITNIAC